MQAKKSFVFCLMSFVLKFSFFLFLFSFFLFSSCKRSTEPISNPQSLQLTVADVSCTEAWLKLKTQIAQNDSSDLKLQLYRNDSLIVNKPLTNADSVLYVDGLQPATTYSFSAKVLKNGKLQATGNRLPVTTMDTTSHNFTWQSFEFGGQGGSSSFYDVVIIDENDIWAVGEIYTENDKYNAAHWDGEKWELKKILFHTFCTHGSMFQYPARSVYVVNYTIFISSGSEITFIKNGIQVKNQCTPVSINKIWGTSDNDLYVVGNNGLIAHYDGRQWTRIESGTTAHIRDIYGRKNYILFAATHYSNTGEKIIGQIVSNSVVKHFNWPFSDRKPYSVWFKNKNVIYSCGDGIFRKVINRKWQILNDSNRYFMNKISGNDYNDLFVVDAFGQIFHFNGISWKFVFNKDFPSGHLYSVFVKKNIIAAVGHKGRAAYVVILKR